MKLNNLTKSLCLLMSFILLAVFTACNNDDGDVNELIASFQAEVSTDNFATINFTNFSQNATSYSWDFGDEVGTSEEENPSYTFSAAGTYTVTLIASNEAGETSSFSDDIDVIDPDEALTLLAGTTSKTWKLDRTKNSMGVGGSAGNRFEFFALSNNGTRNCLYEQTFTFTREGDYIFDDMGEFWGEFGVFDGTDLFETCFEATASNMINKDDADVSAWLSGTHSYSYDATEGTLSLSGLGAWIGVPKLGTEGETTVPVDGVTANIRLAEGVGADTMQITFDYASISNYWVINYISYDDPNDEPDLLTPPIAGFTFEQDESNPLMVTFTNTSVNGVSYAWDFGDDSGTSTEENPTYTYSTEGTYTVTLTVTGNDGSTDAETATVAAVSGTCETDVASDKDLSGGFLLTFEDEVQLGDFGGATSAVVDNPYFNVTGNSSCKVNSFKKNAGAETFAGAAINFDPGSGVLQEHDIANAPIFEMDLYAEVAGDLTIIFEHNPFPDNSPSITNTYTVEAAEVGTWIHITFDLGAQFADNATNFGGENTYTNFVLQYNLGASGADEQVYWDNVQLSPAE